MNWVGCFVTDNGPLDGYMKDQLLMAFWLFEL